MADGSLPRVHRASEDPHKIDGMGMRGSASGFGPARLAVLRLIVGGFVVVEARGRLSGAV